MIAAYLRRIRDVARAGSRYTAYSKLNDSLFERAMLTSQLAISEKHSDLSSLLGLVGHLSDVINELLIR